MKFGSWTYDGDQVRFEYYLSDYNFTKVGSQIQMDYIFFSNKEYNCLALIFQLFL